jgi:hypothetical protein
MKVSLTYALREDAYFGELNTLVYDLRLDGNFFEASQISLRIGLIKALQKLSLYNTFLNILYTTNEKSTHARASQSEKLTSLLANTSSTTCLAYSGSSQIKMLSNTEPPLT